jgi:hypothetical protein
MHVLHDIGTNDCMQIGLHKIKHQIDIFIILSFHNILKRDDVRMTVELLQKDNLNY